jgi:hypothetical protein
MYQKRVKQLQDHANLSRAAWSSQAGFGRLIGKSCQMPSNAQEARCVCKMLGVFEVKKEIRLKLVQKVFYRLRFPLLASRIRCQL